MEPMYYIGLDVHKRMISYCVKEASGKIHAEGSIPARRLDLDCWLNTLPQPWSAAMEATLFSGWIYDYLKPHAAALKVAHPLMLRAIALAKKKPDMWWASTLHNGVYQDEQARRFSPSLVPAPWFSASDVVGP